MRGKIWEGEHQRCRSWLHGFQRGANRCEHLRFGVEWSLKLPPSSRGSWVRLLKWRGKSEIEKQPTTSSAIHRTGRYGDLDSHQIQPSSLRFKLFLLLLGSNNEFFLGWEWISRLRINFLVLLLLLWWGTKMLARLIAGRGCWRLWRDEDGEDDSYGSWWLLGGTERKGIDSGVLWFF